MTTPLSSRVTAGPVVRPVDSGALTWRPAELADRKAIGELELAMALVDHPNLTFTEAEIAGEMSQSSFDLREDSLVGIEATTERLVAYGLVMRPGGPGIAVRAQIYFGGVHPAFRGRGIGRVLLAWQESRALQRLAEKDDEVPGWIVGSADERALAARRLLERAGFVASRWFVGQERDLSEPVPQFDLEPGIRIVPYSAEFSESVRLAKNDAFRDHWGSVQTSRELWESERTLPTFAPEHSFVALSDDEEVAGFLVTDVSEEDWKLQGFSSGYIDLLGVPRAFRNRRIAPALLARAFESFRAAGFDKAVLDVDTDNPSGAVGLYSRMGFVATTKRITYLREY